MTGEIDRDFYCSAVGTNGEMPCDKIVPHLSCRNGRRCIYARRKHPTPDQFRKEYGKEYPDDWAVWWTALGGDGEWNIGIYKTFKHTEHDTKTKTGVAIIVCACTSWGKPPDGWMPE